MNPYSTRVLSMASINGDSETANCVSSLKKMKGISPVSIPDDVVEHIFTFLPIKEAVHNGLVSTRFKNSWRLSRILDFGTEFGDEHDRFDCVQIINRAFERHRGSEIQSFLLDIDPSGIRFFIQKWIRSSIKKNVEEIMLDFIKGDHIVALPVDLSKSETLKILRLRLCVFDLPKTPKGLKFLHTVSLNQVQITSGTIDSLFRNCSHLNTLQLIDCPELRDLTIKARMLRNFKSLTVACCKSLRFIVMDAPSLEEFHYSGLVSDFHFVDVHNLDDVILDYVKSRDMMRSLKVVEVLLHICRVSVLSTTNVFLEGMTRKVVEGEFKEADCKFRHLEEFQIFMESPSHCNLFDIANFMRHCPFLQRFYLDLNDFTFECGMYWEVHQKQVTRWLPLYLNHLKYVEIKGFKGHRHELDIVRFFLQKSPFLETLIVVTPNKMKTRIYYPDYDIIFAIRTLSANVRIRVFEDLGYISPIPPQHDKDWY